MTVDAATRERWEAMDGAKFRKVPVEVHAIQVPHYPGPGPDAQAYYDRLDELAEWCGGLAMPPTDDAPACVLIRTLEGDMRADPGDWIIRGVEGEFYPCKPGIFESTYERVE